LRGRRAARGAEQQTYEKRTLADYKQVVTGYRRVALITREPPEVPDSLLAVAELYTRDGDRLGEATTVGH